MSKKKRIVFVHYRTRELDGVSLEIEHRANVYRKLGHDVYYITGVDGGSNHKNKVFVIPEMDIKSKYSKFLRESLFVNKLLDKHTAIAMYYELQTKIFEKMDKAFAKIQPDIVYVHNIFSVSYNLPVTTALLKILDRLEIPTVIHSPDFWFTRDIFCKPNYKFVDGIQAALPPKREYILKQQVINSIENKMLQKNRGIIAEQITDTFDYEKPYPKIDNFRKKICNRLNYDENDFIVLHATRIATRKSIENAIRYVAELQKAIKHYTPFEFNGKTINKNSRVRFLCTNFVEADNSAYHTELKKLARRLGVSVRWAYNDFSPDRTVKDGKRFFSFWDGYVFSDIVTYTSDWEGFGNQLLEALYFRKPLVLFEYPVFEKDIKQAGYEYISLGNKLKINRKFKLVDQKVLKRAAYETLDWVTDPVELDKRLERNFKLAKKNHHITKLEKDVKSVLRMAAQYDPRTNYAT